MKNEGIDRNKLKNEFNFQLGDLDTTLLTTRVPKGVGLTSNDLYLEGQTLIGGRFSGVRGKPPYSMHISPKYTTGNIVDFRSVAGHELIHAYHISTMPAIFYKSNYSDAVAYRYSLKNYFYSANYKAAFQIMKSPHWNGYYPSNYHIPYGILKWNIY